MVGLNRLSLRSRLHLSVEGAKKGDSSHRMVNRVEVNRAEVNRAEVNRTEVNRILRLNHGGGRLEK